MKHKTDVTDKEEGNLTKNKNLEISQPTTNNESRDEF